MDGSGFWRDFRLVFQSLGGQKLGWRVEVGLKLRVVRFSIVVLFDIYNCNYIFLIEVSGVNIFSPKF